MQNLPKLPAVQWNGLTSLSETILRLSTLRITKRIEVTWNRDFYDYLSAHKQDFEREIGHELIWHGEGKHTLRIYVETPGNIKGTEKGWNEFFSWYSEMAPKFLISARKYLETFNQNSRKR